MREQSDNGAVVVASEHGEGTAAMAMVLDFAWRARERQGEGERVRNGWSSDVVSLFTPLQPD